MRKVATLVVILIVLMTVVSGIWYLINNPSQTPQGNSVKTPNESLQEKITLSNYRENGPSLITLVYPIERVGNGGQPYNTTQVTISADLFIPEEDDYSITSSFDHAGSITIIDGIEGLSYESIFHLTSGTHALEIKYQNQNGQCLGKEYLNKTYGDIATPLNIYFAIRKKSIKQSIKNFTMFDNPFVIETKSSPYKKTDLYIHCPL